MELLLEQVVQQCLGLLATIGHPLDPMTLDPQVSAIGRPRDPMTLDLLTINLRDDMCSNTMVMFLRLVTSAELQRRQEFFAPFIMVGAEGLVRNGLALPCFPCLGSYPWIGRPRSMEQISSQF